MICVPVTAPSLLVPSPRLWVHEVYRVYYDRLIDDTDRSWVHDKVKELVKTHFKEDYTGLFRHLLKPGSSAPSEDDMRSLMFGDYMQPDSVSGGRARRSAGTCVCAYAHHAHRHPFMSVCVCDLFYTRARRRIVCMPK